MISIICLVAIVALMACHEDKQSDWLEKQRKDMSSRDA